MTKLLTQLHQVKEIIRQGWTQHVLARNRYGESIGYANKNATCWCIGGAVLKVTGLDGTTSIMSCLETSLKTLSPNQALFNYNDNLFRTQQDILALVQHSIERETTNDTSTSS